MQIDTKKHVAPITKQFKEVQITSANKVKTITKYSFYESGELWIKVVLELPSIHAHPKEKLLVDFTERTVKVQVFEW